MSLGAVLLGVVSLGVVSLGVGALPAQQALGATYRTATSTASRGGLVGAPGVLVARFDHDDCIGWGRTTTTPNRRLLRGIVFAGEDKNGSTVETYSLHVYTEDPALPGFPAPQPLLTLGPFSTASGAAGIVRQNYTHVFPQPLEVPADRDLFVGIQVAAAPGWPNDGFAVQCVLGAASNWPQFDAPGAAAIQHGSYALSIDAAGRRFYASPRQLLVDLLTDAPGGACTALHNQANYPIGTQSPGSGGYLSGLHPDVVAPPRNAGRRDLPGHTFLDAASPNGTPVFFLVDLGGFGPELPAQNFVPGSVGAFCLKSPTTTTVALGLVQNGAASLVLPVPTGIRSALQGLPLLHQAVALTPALTLRASPCQRQVF